MARLLEDLLATARSRSVAFVDQQVDLSLLARHSVEEVRVLAAERGLRLTLRLTPGRSSSPTPRPCRGPSATSCPMPCASRPAAARSPSRRGRGRVGLARRARRGAGDRRGGPGAGVRPVRPSTRGDRHGGPRTGPGHRPAGRRGARGPDRAVQRACGWGARSCCGCPTAPSPGRASGRRSPRPGTPSAGDEAPPYARPPEMASRCRSVSSRMASSRSRIAVSSATVSPLNSPCPSSTSGAYIA